MILLTSNEQSLILQKEKVTIIFFNLIFEAK